MREQSTHTATPTLATPAGRTSQHPPGPLEAALFYRALGWSVIPTSDKKPHFTALSDGASGWQQFRDTPADERAIEAWYRVAPDAGVAVITGAASGLVVCDIEREGLAAVPPEILNAETPTATTPSGGLHVYFAVDRHVPTQRRNKLGWGDLQGEGAYVVAPSGLDDRTWLIAPDQAPLAPWVDFAHLLEPKGNGKGSPSTEAIPSLEVICDPLDDLLRWDADPRFVEMFCALVGIGVPVGEKFRCLLPGHGPDSVPSANLWPDPKTGRVLYRCWQQGKTFALAQVYAAVVSGKPAEQFTRSTLAIWKLRLLLDSGLVSAPDVAVPALPEDAPDYAREAYPGLIRLFQARALSKMGLSGPITPDFFGPWCGVSSHQAKEARHYYRTHGIIHKTGERAGRAHLYLPGRGNEELPS